MDFDEATALQTGAQLRSRCSALDAGETSEAFRNDETSSSANGSEDSNDATESDEESLLGRRTRSHNGNSRDLSRLSGPSPTISSSTPTVSGSGSSSGSATTVIQALPDTFDEKGKPSEDTRRRPRDLSNTSMRIDALSFLDPDSPAITEEVIQRSVAEAATWRSPSARSSSSASSPVSQQSQQSTSTAKTEVTADLESEIVKIDAGAVTAYRYPADTSKQSPQKTKSMPQHRTFPRRQHSYGPERLDRWGTPEMPRGTANLPHVPHNVLQPRPLTQSSVKHLPRAEKLPMTGYELLASRLTSRHRHKHVPGALSELLSSASYSSSPGSSPTSASATSDTLRPRRPSIASSTGTFTTAAGSHRADVSTQLPLKPIYRRFEGLNHRLLLHLQDELSELEEQLHRLDTADTQTRRMQSSIAPASRRAEHLAGGELQWHRTDVLGKVGFKLGQYNQVLSSFTATLGLPSPSAADVDSYRSYLATAAPIAEIETRFLDVTDDLVDLSCPAAPSLTDDSGTSSPDEALLRNAASEYFSSPPSPPLSGGMPTPMPLPRKAPHYSRGSQPSSDIAESVRGSRPGTGVAASLSGSSVLPPGEMDTEKELLLPTPRGPDHGLEERSALLHLALLLATAVLVPVLGFAVLADFGARMVLVLLVGTLVLGALLVQSGVHHRLSVWVGKEPASGHGFGLRDVMLCSALYGGVMAVVAGVVR